MPAYCSATQVVEFFPQLGLDLAGQQELSTAAVELSITEVSAEILSAANRLGLSLPVTEPAPVTAEWLIVESLTAELVSAEILAGRAVAASLDPVIQRQAEFALKSAEERFGLFASGRLSAAWVETLPTDALCARADVERYVPGFTATATQPPTTSTIDRWILRQSAIVRAVGRLLGYPVASGSLTTDQARSYRDLVSRQVGAWTLRARALAQYSGGIDPQVNHLAGIALVDLIEFGRGRLYSWVF